MKSQYKLALSILAVSLVGCGESQSKKTNDENSIRTAVAEYQDAFNHQNGEKMAALWAAEAVYYPMTGATAQGKKEIVQLFKEQFSRNQNPQIEISATKIAFPSPDQAVQKGIMKLHISGQPEGQLAYQVSLIQENGKWLINEVDEIEIIQPLSNFEHLKDLAWMVGKWEDTDDNVEVFLDNQWDKNKNFLTQHFKMQIFEQETLEGRQIIGWDPEQKLIRSWLFDSDGGFGQGVWEYSGNSWYADMSYTLNDGSRASSRNIYTPIDTSNYTFASTDRVVAGQILPDTDPVHLEKVH